MSPNTPNMKISYFLFALFVFLFFSQSISIVHCQINVWPKPRVLSWPYPQANFVSPLFRIISPDHKHLSVAV
ncbi:hypothetical protein C5167_001918 [Papaver somniferum]|uniref:Uncharacterized protein n=1 Tax=Papaver somniferum TaxID=3469 RepID=A0A4Y7L0I7_PAPSO|nr:hypothetical protein C5167_001918 [Papaver somniferum]